ncbi:hypothetical protein HB364_17835 [Pseudoflavitalea sp. X16]|uniref:hypothetical protein n=1 Tax=Paraflavitalea devenefica TaxID=2716334 RepID=UPI0014232A5D|nr:hypothetical protein [Paraflavitalea devenefica]NII26956.1 hypothetical protein [Paraflavitalea devenefica]
MHETTTVDEAISKGQQMINYPAFLIVLGIPGASTYLVVQNILPVWVLPVGFILGLGLAWLYWGIMIPKWRLWAFENVRNVHELKKRAIREKLIWPDNSFWRKIEIWTPLDKERWLSLQSKFNKEDVFTDDLAIPAETIIGYSKGKNYFQMAIMLVILGGGVFLIVSTGNYIVGAIAVVIGAWLSYKEYRQATNTKPQIIVNDKGIQTISTPFYEWKDITNEEAIGQRSGKHTYYYLIYDYPGGSAKLQIDDYETDQRSLNNLLSLYRGRYQKKQNRR